MIDLNDRRLASLLVDVIDRRVEQKLRALLATTRYGVVVGAPDTAKRQVAVKLLGQEDPSPGFVYGEVEPVDGDAVRIVIDPKGDRYVDAVLGRSIDLEPYVAPAPIPSDVQIFTASGTWTKPTDPRWAFSVVEVIGGGAAGGGCSATGSGDNAAGAGGGAGGFARKRFMPSDLAGAASFTVTVGSAGTGSSGGNGGAGTASSFAGTGITTVLGNGGAGGSNGTNQAGSQIFVGGQGGNATGGDVNVAGGDGMNSEVAAGLRIVTGNGGSTPLGMGGRSGNAAVGGTGTGYGAGGGGSSSLASSSARAGGAGAPGVVIVTSYFV